MIEMNAVIANNVLSLLKKTGKKQNDLAEALGISKQVMSKLLNGSRTINAVELLNIAEYFCIDVKELSRIPNAIPGTSGNAVRAFMGTFEAPAAKQALEIADELADLIIFHAKVRENAEEMIKPWEE